jgi:hypothetical protein
LREENMVKITLELSELEVEMFLHCIEGAIDTEHVTGKDVETVEKIKKQLSKYL